MITNLKDLAEEMGGCEADDSGERIVQLISKRLFKYTTCGIGFYSQPTYVTVSGYCEGDVGDCEPITLKYPFTDEQWWEAVGKADKDGCGLWGETHGCDQCGTEDEFGCIPVNPDCKACGGEGVVI